MNFELSKVQAFGQLGYPPKRMAILLDIAEEDVEQFINSWSDLKSPLRRAYETGRAKAEYAIDKALYTSAKEGDIDALNKLNERRLMHQENEDVLFQFKKMQEDQFH